MMISLMAKANVLWFTRISADRKLLIPDFSHATDEMLTCIEAFDISDRGIKLKLKDSSKALRCWRERPGWTGRR